MAEPRSRRGRILKNLKRQLETITVANGYVNNVQKVTFNARNWAEYPVAETPILFIVDDTTQYAYHAGKLTERTWDLGIYGFMRDKTQEEMEEFISDIEECLVKNITLTFDNIYPGPVAHMRIKNIITDGQMFAELEGSQLFKMTISVIYTACIDSIR